MEYVQERITTLHDFGEAAPDAPTGDLAVVVPLTGRDHGSAAAERVFAELSALAPARVYVALRAGRDRAAEVAGWIDCFDLDAEVLWCNAPAVDRWLADRDLAGGGATGDLSADGGAGDPHADGGPCRTVADDCREEIGPPGTDAGAPEYGDVAGKGRDVWLALGPAARHEYVAVHDADATTFGAADVRKLAFPLARGFDYVKGYYARVEDDGLYGRLCRLFVRPLLRAIGDDADHPLLSYLESFRYPLAGEFAATGDVVRSLRVQPGWGLEVGTLGDAYRTAGFDGSAQVDLGVHRHEHRPVEGPTGLGDMSHEVGRALFQVLADGGVAVDFADLPERYRATARAAVDRYAADAAFNGLPYDADAERAQVAEYAGAIEPPTVDWRLPAWRDCPIDPDAVLERSRAALADAADS